MPGQPDDVSGLAQQHDPGVLDQTSTVSGHFQTVVPTDTLNHQKGAPILRAGCCLDNNILTGQGTFPIPWITSSAKDRGQGQGTVNGIDYVLGVSRGRIGQFYPGTLP
ncbi:hypothetical protein GCM10010102_15550 [Promicromonospora citrea]|uniref:Uncharacterized protein n=1 Tax=Promicromonospora citrea TaxID=43677 RepID=A0A8H9GFN9_9MICO|nr:hypothetical protein GCM10010102_15550 [Promicromonospora citrea]